METVKVVCGIIWKGNKVFIARRKPEKNLGGYWEFPGGKIEKSETHEDSLKRELIEEFEMKVDMGGHFLTVFHEYENFRIELISYSCHFLEASFVMTDHDKYEWIEIGDLGLWNLAPADIPIANELKERNTF